VRADTAELTDTMITGFGQRSRKGEVFIEDKAEVASRVGGVE